jgi:hypothetical protein
VASAATRKRCEVQATLKSTKDAISTLETAVSDVLANLKAKCKVVPQEPDVPAKPSIKPDERKPTCIEGLEKVVSEALADMKTSCIVSQREVSAPRKLNHKVVAPEWLLSYALSGPLEPLFNGSGRHNFPATSLLYQPVPLLAGTSKEDSNFESTHLLSSCGSPSEANNEAEFGVALPGQYTLPKISFKLSMTKKATTQQAICNPLELVSNDESQRAAPNPAPSRDLVSLKSGEENENYSVATIPQEPASTLRVTRVPESKERREDIPEQPAPSNISFKLSATKQTTPQHIVRNALATITNGESKFIPRQLLVGEPKFHKGGEININQEAATPAPSSRVEGRSNGQSKEGSSPPSFTFKISQPKKTSKIAVRNPLEPVINGKSNPAVQIVSEAKPAPTKIEGATADATPQTSAASERAPEKR